MSSKNPVSIRIDDIDNKLVVKSNYLTEASYRLTTQEQRIVLLLASMIKLDDEDFQTYRINVKDFNKLIGVKNEAGHPETKQIIRKLKERVLIIKDITAKRELRIGWVSSAKYYNRKGFVELRFDPKLKPYLLKIRKYFTKYKLKDVIRLKSSYSIRIYELLKQYEMIGKRYFNLDEMKKILGLEPDRYKLYDHFKSEILNKAKAELSKQTDLVFNFKEKKKDREVIGIHFLIKSKRDVKPLIAG